MPGSELPGEWLPAGYNTDGYPIIETTSAITRSVELTAAIARTTELESSISRTTEIEVDR